MPSHHDTSAEIRRGCPGPRGHPRLPDRRPRLFRCCRPVLRSVAQGDAGHQDRDPAHAPACPVADATSLAALEKSGGGAWRRHILVLMSGIQPAAHVKCSRALGVLDKISRNRDHVFVTSEEAIRTADYTCGEKTTAHPDAHREAVNRQWTMDDGRWTANCSAYPPSSPGLSAPS